MDALWLSVQVALGSLVLSFPLALALGWWMARREFVGKTLLHTLLMTPMVLPPVVTGFVLLRLLGRRGLLAPVMELLHLEIAFTRWAAIVAAAVVGFPLFVMTVRLSIEAVDPALVRVARSLGASPWKAFWRITFPMALPGIGAGALLSFARALGEFGATAVFAGNVAGETQTLSLAIYSLLEVPDGESQARVLVWVSLAISLVAMACYEWLLRVQRRRAEVHEGS